jgi:NAD(P)-dependent dehydrogenase (short-subunit alcohol dehydrogenase family)
MSVQETLPQDQEQELDYPQEFPPQHQDRQPGIEAEMDPEPLHDDPEYRGSGKLRDKVALITGGDSGIGRAVAIAYAKEGADVAILYLDEHQDAEKTRQLVAEKGRRCLAIAGDVGSREFCFDAVRQVVEHFGRLDILVNNAAQQYLNEGLEKITEEQVTKVFRTNIFGYIFMAQAALPHLPPGGAVVNTTSVEANTPQAKLMDYASTKGAILTFTRGLAKELIERGIRVNAVAPGPIWTPLIPASFPAEDIKQYGADTPMKRAGQPCEMAPCYVFLASSDASYMMGQCLHPNGGMDMSS